jgi:hypothetical protein
LLQIENLLRKAHLRWFRWGPSTHDGAVSPDGASWTHWARRFGFPSKRNRATPALVSAHLLLAIASVPAVAADPAALVSHRAEYAVSLLKASQRDGVRGVSGTLSYVFTDRCDGYTIESSMRLAMSLANGADNEIEQRYAAWEAKDNRAASFRMLVRENGKVSDSYHGTATLDETGAGTATYIGDQEVTYTLPAGTLLSSNHLQAVLEAAAKGEHIVNRAVMDGSFDDGPYRVGGVIGPSDRKTLAGGPPLTQGPLWPISLAYFPLESDQDTPEYEMLLRIGPNGVARSLMQDFGGFTLSFELSKAEPVTGPSCAD